MKIIGKRGGFTLLEVMMSMVITVLILFATGAMMWATLRCYNSETAQSTTDNDAVLAMQKMVTDVREAKAAALSDNGRTLTITLPIVTQAGYYDRSQADTANPIYYYESDSSGVKGRMGTYLWRVKGTDSWVVRKDIDSLLFEMDTERSIKMTIRTKATIAHGYRTTELTQRVVYLRNY